MISAHSTELLLAEKTIASEILVPAGISDVWNAWTTTEGITSFFAPAAHIDARPGGAFETFFLPDAPQGQKGADGMVILACQENELLSFTWNAPPQFPEIRKQRTVVIVRFQPVSARSTRVFLHHTGWGVGGEWDDVHAYFSDAWPHVLAKLQERFIRGRRDWTDHLASLRNSSPAEAKS